MSETRVPVEVECADIRETNTDLLVSKHAAGADGPGRDVAESIGIDRSVFSTSGQLPNVGESELFHRGAVAANVTLLIGVKPVSKFGYDDIRRYARRSLDIASRMSQHTSVIAHTIHGVGYGLNEREAFESQLAGLADAIKHGSAPRELSRIKFAERDPNRADRLRGIREDFLQGRSILSTHKPTDREWSESHDSETKPHVFVAMPFDEQFDQVYYQGIKPATDSVAERTGRDLLCERVDEDSFTGPVTKQIKSRIDSANFVVADMTGANPNVYLEVGYALGSDIPTLLLAQDTDELEFNVQSRNTISYDRRRLDALRQELEHVMVRLDSIEGN